LKSNRSKFRVGAVSYFNTMPLVWGMLHGDERDDVQLSFSVPSECASQLEPGQIDIGLVPVAEIARQGLLIASDVGIACFGAVRSILLFSRVPWRNVRTLAADASSRTSVQLARIILAERYGVSPQITEHEPRLEAMLTMAHAALVIGDPALRLQPQQLGFEWLDLGDEWKKLTGLPMVFAAWAGKHLHATLGDITRNSFEYGRTRIDEIVASEYHKRGITHELARTYLRHHIRFSLGQVEMEGLRRFLEMADLTKGKDAYAATGH
jgi:predicted solute-binding protein